MTPRPKTRSLPPPRLSVGPMGWLRRNLFSSPLNVGLTVVAIWLLYLAVPPVVRWALLDADWIGTDREACTSGGACWVFILARFNQFIFGFFPEQEQWRVMLAFGILVVLMVLLVLPGVKRKTWIVAFCLFVYPVIAFVLFSGGVLGLPPVESSQWGGLMLTLIIAVIGIVAALPLGIVFALGRRSEMPIVRALCIAGIEFWRGVPLVMVLFMASVMLPLFLPEGVTFNKLLRALIGIILFQSAYMAEVVRGGLQAIPRGQYEAARALGLRYWQYMGFVVLPQALKMVIPGIVNTFIALFKDTSLVLIIGLFDLLGIVQAAFTDPNWLGFAREGYVFAGLLFWAFCFGMSRYSQRLERKLSPAR